MEIESAQPMPLSPRPAVAQVSDRRIEAPHNPSNCGSFRPTPGSVPFDVFSEGVNRIARETDTFRLSDRLSEQLSDKARPESKPDLATLTKPKTGWAKLGEVLEIRKPTPTLATSKATPEQQIVQRHSGTGRLIDVII